MVDYREILRLDMENYSQRQIEASTGISRHTVSDVLAAAKAAGISDRIKVSPKPVHDDSVRFHAGSDVRLFPAKQSRPQGEYLHPFGRLFFHPTLLKCPSICA